MRSCKDSSIAAYEIVKTSVEACVRGDVNVSNVTGFIKDYTVHKARTMSSHHLNIGALRYDNDRRSYTLTYYKDGSEYQLLFRQGPRGPRSIRACYDENDTNVMNKITLALGVTKDFHQIPTTPGMLGYSMLKVSYNTGDERIFQKNDVIILKAPESV